MSKKRTISPRSQRASAKPITHKSSNAQRTREAKDAQKFFIVLGIGTVLLVIFLYFIFVGRG